MREKPNRLGWKQHEELTKWVRSRFEMDPESIRGKPYAKLAYHATQELGFNVTQTNVRAHLIDQGIVVPRVRIHRSHNNGKTVPPSGSGMEDFARHILSQLREISATVGESACVGAADLHLVLCDLYGIKRELEALARIFCHFAVSLGDKEIMKTEDYQLLEIMAKRAGDEGLPPAPANSEASLPRL